MSIKLIPPFNPLLNACSLIRALELMAMAVANVAIEHSGQELNETEKCMLFSEGLYTQEVMQSERGREGEASERRGGE